MSMPLQDVLEGKYKVLEKIGEGGIGAVYKVRHRLLEEVRVIKVLRPEAASKEDLRERFLHEARMAIRLKHPNIAQLHDFSIAEDGRAYIVMEFIDGVALDAATGELRWTCDAAGATYGTPVLTQIGGVDGVVPPKGHVVRLADGKEPDLKMGLLSALLRYQVDEFRTARRLKR